MNTAAREKFRQLYSRIAVQQALIAKAHAGIQRDLDSLALLLGQEPTAADASRIMPIAVALAAASFNVAAAALYQKNRLEPFVSARQSAMYLAMAFGLSSTKVGAHFGVDHTNALAARKSVQNRVDTDPPFARRIESLIDQLQQKLSAPVAADVRRLTNAASPK